MLLSGITRIKKFIYSLTYLKKMGLFDREKEYDKARKCILTCSAGTYALSHEKTLEDYTLTYISEHAVLTYTPKHATEDKSSEELEQKIKEFEQKIMCALYSKMRKEGFEAVTDYRYQLSAKGVVSMSMPRE